MRSAIGGWVEKSDRRLWPAKGLEMYIEAVAGEAEAKGMESAEIILRALIRPLGWRVSLMADASARNSRRREMASWIS